MDCAKGITSCSPTAGDADYKGFGKATKPMLPSSAADDGRQPAARRSLRLIADEKTH